MTDGQTCAAKRADGLSEEEEEEEEELENIDVHSKRHKLKFTDAL